MNHDVCDLVASSKLISPTYIAQGRAALNAREKLVQSLISNRRLPAVGWDEATIEMLLQECAAMDSNNFLHNIGVGEREGRVACPMVARRHYRLAHGIGRSGDIAAQQPKAAGSSLLAKLTTFLVTDALRLAGLQPLCHTVTVLPVATGVAIALTLQALMKDAPVHRRTVIMSRIDQKTCYKSILSVGCHIHLVPCVLHGDQLTTDVDQIQAAVQDHHDKVLCVMTTTSCFAPRACDDVAAVARVCKAHNVAHVINNAYGVQASSICKHLSSACTKGRVDAVIQSTDKNFMVPVGGAVIASPGPCSTPLQVVNVVNTMYPGRAAMAPLLDVLMTLLHWGAPGWVGVLREREELYMYTRDKLGEMAMGLGERVLQTPDNPISLAITLNTLTHTNTLTPGNTLTPPNTPPNPTHTSALVTQLGSMLFHRGVSGARVVARGAPATVGPLTFKGFGAHCDAYPHDYLTVAAAVGGSRHEVDVFVERFRACFVKIQRGMATAQGAAA